MIRRAGGCRNGLLQPHNIMEIVRAGIGIYENGKVKLITVERDGNPAYCGSLLYSKYQTIKRVEKLLELGDLFVVREKIKPISNLGHYVLVNGGKAEDIRLQEDVTVSLYRDVRVLENNIIKKSKKSVVREYSSPRMAFESENVEYLYIYDKKFEEWETYAIDGKKKRFDEIWPSYRLLIKNLVYRDDITSLTKEEWERLNYLDR